VLLGANFLILFLVVLLKRFAPSTHGPCVTELADREDAKCMRHDTRPNQHSPAHQRTRQAGRQAGRRACRMDGWMNGWMIRGQKTLNPKPSCPIAS